MKKTVMPLAAGLAAPLLGGFAAAQNHQVDLQFVTHLRAGMPEQDVFVEQAPGSGSGNL